MNLPLATSGPLSAVATALGTVARWTWGAVRVVLPDIVDLHIYGGIALVAWGVWMAWPPGGPIAAGLGLVGLGLMFMRRPKE